MHYYQPHSDQPASGEFFNTTLASNEFCFTNESLAPNIIDDANRYTTQSPKNTKRGFMFDHEVSLENMEKSPEFNRSVEDAQKSDTKFKKAQSRFEGTVCDLPLSTNFDESNRKRKVTIGKSNKSSNNSMRELDGRQATNTSGHYHSNLTDSSFHSVNPYKKTLESRRSQKYSSVPSGVRTPSESSLANNLKKEVEALRENLRMKEKQLKESLLQIEFLQKDLKTESRNNLGEEFHTMQVNVSEKSFKEENLDWSGNSHQKIQALKSQNDELKEGLRNEIMASERQRTQIDMLKGILEGRLERLGIFSSSKMKNSDMVVEYESMKRSYTENERTFQSLTHKVADLASKLQITEQKLQEMNRTCENFTVENSKLNEDLENGLKVLQQTREELVKVEEERNSLIEYINTELSSHGAIKSENKELREKLALFQKQNNSLMKETEVLRNHEIQLRLLNKDLLKSTEELKTTVEITTNEKHTLIKANLQNTKDLSSYLAEIQQKNTELQALKLRFEDNKIRLEAEKLKEGALSHEKNDFLEKRLMNNESMISEFRVKIQELEIDRFSLQNKLQILDVQKTSLESQLKRTEQLLDEANKSLEQKETFSIEEQAKYRTLLKERDHELQSFGTINIQMKEQLSQTEEKCNHLTHENENLNAELNLKIQEAKNVRIELETCKSELKGTRGANDMLLKNIDSREKALAQLQSEFKKTSEELHRVQHQNEGADDYNLALKKRVESLETELLNKRCMLEARNLNIMHLTNERDGKGKTAVNLAKDLEDLSQEVTKISEELEESKLELKRAKGELTAANEVAKTSLESLHSFVEEMTRSYSVGIELQDTCGEKLKEILNLGSIKIEQKQSDASLAKKCAYLKEWLLCLLDEVELAARKRMQHIQEYKQLFKDCKELKEKLQRKFELERGFEEREKELKDEMLAIREEKMSVQRELMVSSQREETREDELQKMKKEIKRLEAMINSNSGLQSSLKQELRELEVAIDEKNGCIKARDQQINELEETVEALGKDKSHLVEILEIFKDGIFSEEFLKALQSYQDVAAEIKDLEKEKAIIETELDEKEAFLKTGLKHGTLLGAEIILRRKDIDKLRDKLQNTDTKLSRTSFNLTGIFRKRKSSFFSELKDKQQVEKRKQQEGFENEQKLKELISENQDLQFQYELMTETASQLKEKLRIMTGDRSLTLNNPDRSTTKLTKMSSVASLNKTNDKTISIIEHNPRFGISSQPQGIYLEHNQSDSLSTGLNNYQANNDSLVYEQDKENKTPHQQTHKRSQSVPRNSVNSLDKTGKFVSQQVASSKKQEDSYGAQNICNLPLANGGQISLRDKLSQARSALRDVVVPVKGSKVINNY